MLKKHILVISIIFLLTFPSLAAEPMIGTEAPTFFAHTIEGKPFFLSKEIEKEQPIVLSFFATWCIPCRQELPVVDTLATEFPEIQFYLVNVSGLIQNEKR